MLALMLHEGSLSSQLVLVGRIELWKCLSHLSKTSNFFVSVLYKPQGFCFFSLLCWQHKRILGLIWTLLLYVFLWLCYYLRLTMFFFAFNNVFLWPCYRLRLTTFQRVKWYLRFTFPAACYFYQWCMACGCLMFIFVRCTFIDFHFSYVEYP